MKLYKRYGYVILLVLQITLMPANEIKNNTETSESPRLSQDSYIEALSNSRKGVLKSNKTDVVYVTASNQAPKVTQHITKPIITPINTPLTKTFIIPATNSIPTSLSSPLKAVATKPISSTKTSSIRREDNHYDSGPYAEPNGYNSFSSSDSQYQHGYTSNGGDTYSNSYFPQDKYGPPKKYGLPNYKQPHVKPAYGAPDYGYGPSSNGPLAPVYGPPMKHSYGIPYEGPSFFDKFKLKLDILTVAKILLKIIIFKKIVKFIAIICLLLFIPKLIHIKKNKDDDDDEEERSLRTFDLQGRTSDNLYLMSSFVQHAIDTYSKQQEGCEKVGCRMMKVIDKVDEEYTFASIAEMFGRADD